MSAALSGLIYCFEKNLDYAPKLVADVSQSQMSAQPSPDLPLPMNHPAWVFSHLNVYLPIIHALITGKSFDDPKEHRFGMLSQPESNPGIYADKEELIGYFVDQHRSILELLKNADQDLLSKPMPLPRWQPIMPVLGIALPYLMLNHENSHLGQLSAWRRVMKLPRV